MAFSASVKRSQDIVVCGLCEKDTKVKVKCMDCDLYLCQTCKDKGHAKFKNADLHDVVDLNDIHSHEAKFKPVRCREHAKQYSCMYCLTCEQLVCPICISKTHHKHDMGEMETFFKNKFTQVQGFRQKVENQMDEVLEKLNLLQVTKEEDESLIKELQEIEESFERKDNVKFIGGTSNLQKDMEKFNKSISIFEKLLENIPKSVVKDITFKKKGKYKTSHLYYLISITSDEYGKLWIADTDQCIKQLEITDGVNAVNSYKIEGDINEIRCLNKNKIYFTSSTRILCLIRKNTIKMLKDFTPNKVFTIHISKGDEIIVGMDLHETERSDDQPVIIRLDFDGKIIQVYKNTRGQLLTRDIVQCCTTFKDGTICYLDNPLFAENTFGGVVHIDKNGIIQWKYIGNPFIDCEDQPFSPIEVITTPSNNLIISDKFVGALHILTSKGTLLTFLDLKSIGIYTPSVMTMDIHGTLWIKSREKEIQFLNAVKCSGL